MAWLICSNGKLPEGVLQLQDRCIVRVTGEKCLLLKRSEESVWADTAKDLHNRGWVSWRYRFYGIKQYYKLL